ncbi:MAG: DUF4124 domain-containing protein [Porticoccaceae bacterium]
MRSRWVLTGCLTLLLSAPADAAVFKCVDEKGKLTFRDRPCESEKNGVSEKIEDKGSRSGQPMSESSRKEKKRTGLGTFIDRAEDLSGKSSP